MANTLPQPAPETQPHAVLRAIFMAGQPVAVGDVVHLTRQQAQELAAAGKVSAAPVEPAKPAASAAPAAGRPRASARNVAG